MLLRTKGLQNLGYTVPWILTDLSCIIESGSVCDSLQVTQMRLSSKGNTPNCYFPKFGEMKDAYCKVASVCLPHYHCSHSFSSAERIQCSEVRLDIKKHLN